MRIYSVLFTRDENPEREFFLSDIHERIYEYFDGELNREEVSAFEKHLSSCPECAERIAELEHERELFSSLRIKTPDISSAVMREIKASKRRVFLKRSLGVCAAALVLVFGASFVLSNYGTKKSMAPETPEEALMPDTLNAMPESGLPEGYGLVESESVDIAEEEFKNECAPDGGVEADGLDSGSAEQNDTAMPENESPYPNAMPKDEIVESVESFDYTYTEDDECAGAVTEDMPPETAEKPAKETEKQGFFQKILDAVADFFKRIFMAIFG